MRALLVVNPAATAATVRARDVLGRALSSQTRLEVVETKARGHATELATAAVDEFDIVVAMGGDGTVNEVVNGLLAQGPRPGLPALAVVPGGGTNVFARALGLPNSAKDATSMLMEALRRGRRRTVGLGRADDRWFTFNAGLGFDAGVVRLVDRSRAAGRRATPGRYVLGGFRQFFMHTERRERALLLERPGSEPEPLGLALVCNTAPWTYLGARAVDPCPRASFDTGLDLFGLRRLRTLPTLWHLQQILARRPHPRGRDVLAVHDASELVLSSGRPQPFQLDGEDLGDRTRVVLTSVPAALCVVA